MEKELISTIITTYKRTDLLDRAIQSVLKQDYPFIELIVVDDNDRNSVYRDKNIELMNKYKTDDRVIYLKHEKNMNGANARNTGLKAAKGNLITFLDDDDFYDSSRFSTLIPLLSKSDKNIGCIMSGYRYIKDGKKRRSHEVLIPNDVTTELLKATFNIGSGSNFIIKREVIDQVGDFDTSFSRHQDYEFLVRVSEKYEFITHPSSLLYIQTDSSQQNKTNIENLIQTKQSYLDKYSYLINDKNKEDIMNSHLENIIYNIVSNNECRKYSNVFKKYLNNKPSIYRMFNLAVSLLIGKVIG